MRGRMVDWRPWADRPLGYASHRYPADAPKPWLNLGCGTDYRDGWINADWDPTGSLKADKRFDLKRFPWPFADGELGLVYMSHVIEHIPHTLADVDKDGFFAVMDEVHRVLKPGGYAYFRTPHWEAENNPWDPTHTRVIHPWNFRYFDPTYTFSFYTSARFVVTDMFLSQVHLWGRHPRFGRHRQTLTEHLYARAPMLRPFLVRKPVEMTYVLRKA